MKNFYNHNRSYRNTTPINETLNIYVYINIYIYTHASCVARYEPEFRALFQFGR